MVLEDELSSLNRELCMFPTRAFEFKHAGTVVIEQVSPLTATVYSGAASCLDCSFLPGSQH